MVEPASLQQLNLDHVSPATRLLEKRRQMFEVQEALEAQKEEFARREDLFKRREEQLRKKDIELQESLIRFNKFLQENDAKRSRAEKKASDEVKLRLQKESEVEQLTGQLEVLTRDKEKMKLVLEKNMRFLKYLEQVLEITEDYGEISELLDRYETLTEHHQDLTAWAQECAEKNDSFRNELQNYLKQGQDTKLKGHNEVAKLQKQLETSQLETLGVMGVMDRKMVEQAEKTLELGKIRWAIENLYERCRSRSKVAGAYVKDINHQLKVCQDFMMDLAFIVKGAGKAQMAAAQAAGGVVPKPAVVKPVAGEKKERRERKEKTGDDTDTNTERGSTVTDVH